MKLFLSCVSSEFKSYRLKLANHLAAARGESFTVKVQEGFRQGGFTLLEQLADFLRGCDLVVHLVGDACGARPEPEHVRALLMSLGETPGDPLPAWSYTQWEREDGHWTLGGGRVEIRNGCVVAAWWVGADRNRVAEEFALRLQRETGCQIIDREHGRVLAPAPLQGMSRREDILRSSR